MGIRTYICTCSKEQKLALDSHLCVEGGLASFPDEKEEEEEEEKRKGTKLEKITLLHIHRVAKLKPK